MKDKYKKQMPVRTEACEEKAARILPGGGEPDSGTYAYAAGRGGSDEFKSCPVGGAEPGGGRTASQRISFPEEWQSHADPQQLR